MKSLSPEWSKDFSSKILDTQMLIMLGLEAATRRHSYIARDFAQLYLYALIYSKNWRTN